MSSQFKIYQLLMIDYRNILKLNKQTKKKDFNFCFERKKYIFLRFINPTFSKRKSLCGWESIFQKYFMLQITVTCDLQ